MKVNLAVHTAQEGYAWQPGTAYSPDDLLKFKKHIGKFPSPDSMDFPFGGVFLLDDRVVFYRYHVAKKIDFRGRDALYCVLGAVSREEAAKIDPAALFAYPEFAGPMKPFPVSLEVPEADPAAVPEWLKNLDKMTLDVRISGPVDKPRYDVAQEPIPEPIPPPIEVQKQVASVESAKEVVSENAEKPSSVESSESNGDEQTKAEGDNKSASVPNDNKLPKVKDDGPQKKEQPKGLGRFFTLWPRCGDKEKVRCKHLTIVGVMTVILITAIFCIVIWCKSHGACVPSGTETSKTNTVQVASLPKDTNDVAKATAPADNAPSVTNSVAVVTNVLTVATNAALDVKTAAASIARKKNVPSQSSPKNPAKGQEKNLGVPKGNSPAAKKKNSPKQKNSKEKR